jgi:hypothetical protein
VRLGLLNNQFNYVMAVKNEKNDYHNDENDQNDVESRRQAEQYYTSPSPSSIQLGMEGTLPLKETVLGNNVNFCFFTHYQSTSSNRG